MTSFASVRNLVHRAGGRTVLEVESLLLESGTIHALLGHNGAGKTTLLRLLSGIDKPTNGDIRLGFAASDLIICFQRPYLFRGTVRHNVEYGLRARAMRIAEKHVNKILDQLGVAELLTRNARELSSGESQRVALARALVCRPHGLLLDEPTANLDTPSVSAIEGAIRAFCADGATVVIATHMIECVKRLQARVHRMDSGRIVDQNANELQMSPLDLTKAASLSLTCVAGSGEATYVR